MDKNQLTGVLLILLIFIGWSWFTQPTPEQLALEKRSRDSIEMAQRLENEPILEAEKPVLSIQDDSLAQAKIKSSYGSFGEAAIGNAEIISLENDQLKIDFSTKGGAISQALLKDYKKVISDSSHNETKTDLFLLEDDKNRFNYVIDAAGREMNSSDLFFKANKQGNSIEFTLEAADGAYLKQKYTLNEGYDLDYSVSFNGLKSTGKDGESLKLNWINHLDKLEKNATFEQTYSTIYFKERDESSSDYCSCRGDDEVDKDQNIDWVSHVNQFFNTSLMTKSEAFTYANMETQMPGEKSEDLKILKTELGIPMDRAGAPFKMKMYIGPNEFNTLKGYDNSLEEIIPFGNSIFGTINRWVIRPSFDFLSKYIGSKGIVIIVLIFILKMLLYPLMYKMLHSQARMGALKPKIEKLTEKFKDSPQEKQVETMKIYREYGVSPFGGCMPMVIQMPIWYALFRFFPASITFRQEPFLWATDLSSYDVFATLPFTIPMLGNHVSLFTILWAVTTIMYTYYNTKHMDMSANPAMKYVQYLMPITFLVFFNQYASGLTCYMFFSNLFNILQTVLTKKFVFNDDKIRAELEVQKTENKKKPKKQGFQARIEEAMKKQQEIQKKKDAQKKSKGK